MSGPKEYPLNEDYKTRWGSQDRQGDGKEDCPVCFGRGVVQIPTTGPPMVKRCECVLLRDLSQNLERGWKGLVRAPRIKESPLLEHAGKNVWLTCATGDFKSHLRFIAIRKGYSWNFKVVSDADLMSAWLGTAVVRGMEIYDADVAMRPEIEALTLKDLVTPQDLLILRLGVKTARNQAMSEVLMETLAHRDHIDKVTWVVDQPHYRLQEGHICYSSQLGDFLEYDWEHERIEFDRVQKQTKARQGSGGYKTLPPPDLSGTGGAYKTQGAKIEGIKPKKKGGWS